MAKAKGQLISECLFEKIVWTKIPTKNLIDSAHYTCWAESIKFFVGILVQTIFSKKNILKLTDLYQTNHDYCLYSARQIFLTLLLKFFSCKNLAFMNLPTNR